MKNLVLLLLSIAGILFLSCNQEQTSVNTSVVTLDFDLSKCTIKGNSAYIPCLGQSPEKIPEIIAKFVEAKNVDVICSSPVMEADYTNYLRAILVTFKERPIQNSQGPRPTYDGIIMMPLEPKASRAERPQ